MGKKLTIEEIANRLNNSKFIKHKDTSTALSTANESNGNQFALTGRRSDFSFKCVRLEGSSKKGVLTPDENGCYTICIGALDAHNHAGQFYDFEEAKRVFAEDESLMRRVRRGVLRAEYGHPKKHGLTDQEYFARLQNIEETMVCCTFREIWFEEGKIKDDQGRPVIAIMAKIFPSGPYGEVLRKQLETPGEQACFSIRCFTEDKYIDGKIHRFIRACVTFDYVNEPGIYVAEKLLSMSLESLKESLTAIKPATESYGLESSNSVQSKIYECVNEYLKHDDGIQTINKNHSISVEDFKPKVKNTELFNW